METTFSKAWRSFCLYRLIITSYFALCAVFFFFQLKYILFIHYMYYLITRSIETNISTYSIYLVNFHNKGQENSVYSLTHNLLCFINPQTLFIDYYNIQGNNLKRDTFRVWYMYYAVDSKTWMGDFNLFLTYLQILKHFSSSSY